PTRIGVALAAPPRTLVAADFDGDGRDDLAIGHSGSPLEVLPGDSTRLLGAPRATSLTSGAFLAADFDGDGHVDLAIPGVSIFRGHGDMTFESEGSYNLQLLPQLFPRGAVAADLDGDRRPDFVLGNNVPNDDFSQSLLTVAFNRSGAGDRDGDGILDGLDPCTDTDGDGYGNPG